MHRARLILLLYLIIITTSCIYIPTPDSGPTVPEEISCTFIPGETTEEDVLLKLGNPDQRLYNDRYFIYHKETLAGILFLPGGGMAANTDLNYFCVEFNPDHILKRYKFFDQGVLGNLGGHPENEILKWMGEQSN